MSFRIILLFFICSFSYLSTSAQGLEVLKANEYYKQALYKEAIPFYEKALDKMPMSMDIIRDLANSYYYTNSPEEAVILYQRLVQAEGNEQYHFECGQTLKMLKRYDEAKEHFQAYTKINAEKGQHYIATCNFAMGSTEKPLLQFEVENIKAINSKSADFAPIYQGDKLLFASARSVAIKKGNEVSWTNDAFNQYYEANFNSQGALVGLKPFRDYIGKDINDAPMSYDGINQKVMITSNNFMDGIRHIAAAGLMMDMYSYVMENSKVWKRATESFFPFNANVNSDQPYSTGHPCFTNKGKTLYFASNREGGLGGYDIYVCHKTKYGWTKPKNLGYPINTAGNEMTPFIAENGRLFFASDWHEGYGGMDLFTAEKYAFGWGNVLNLGKQVNSPYDELYPCFKKGSNAGFFVSNREGGRGNEDIYSMNLKGRIPSRTPGRLAVEDKLRLGDDFFRSASSVLQKQKGKTLYDIAMKMYDNPNLILQINAYTDAKGSERNNMIISQKRAKSVADFLKSKGIASKRIKYQGYGEQYLLNRCNNKAICTAAEHAINRRVDLIVVGELTNEGTMLITYNASPDPRIKLQDQENNTIPIPPKQSKGSTKKRAKRKAHYAIGDVIDVANIYYEHNKSSLNVKKSPGLKELFDILDAHKHVVLEISSHTDANGSSSYNKELSGKRARSVRKYLIKKGINEKRLIAKGYGEEKILNRCKNGVRCSSEEHAVNRRTEFKVVGHTGFTYGDIIKVEDISYERNKAKIDMKKSPGLAEIIKILKEHKISVEIRSHTDSKGSAKYNLELSEKRAKAIYDYLVANGVNKYRLKYKGYGEEKLLNKCKDGVRCSDSEHAKNRRTDFKVIGLK